MSTTPAPGTRVLVVRSDYWTTETRAYLMGHRGTVVPGESGQEASGLVSVALDSGITRTFAPEELVPIAEATVAELGRVAHTQGVGFSDLLTDEVGKVTKLTGPNSVSTARQSADRMRARALPHAAAKYRGLDGAIVGTQAFPEAVTVGDD
ncbi:hypothetical protein SCMU_18440 [Sinomonas cyclohexanicum]|uniref:Uncharacterized protein n=1 Tax=Sinomonas cyclohexanicum TaxID=322009 RepID=A0ABN6FIS8_SINCY|nr:hypothetical protein [Corynebacterium cyclohexanicum]BCT76002.1 hypothetical protein SCMU_18440 [Corynebacterium cyclohexanicum]